MTEYLHITYENGQEVSREDTRTLEGQKIVRRAIINEATSAAILEAYPAYVQQNSALGLYTEEETQAVKSGIQLLRAAGKEKKDAINACSSLVDLDNLYFDVSAGQ